ncbi:MAG: hypothetical protein LBQ34_00410 [Alphaproteobacteria bacterium]|jgi:dolichol kinase|nr:hypothetical protein [Alphaproteobacteria bacterium]
MDFNFKQELNRKLIHLSSSIYPIAYLFLSKPVMITIIAVLFVAILFWDIARLKKINLKIITMFSGFVREKESAKLTGATYFLAAILLVIVLFPKDIAIISMFVLIFCDTAAALFGKAFGKTKIKGTNKSLVGFIAFIAVGFIIMIIYLNTGEFFINPRFNNIVDISAYLLVFIPVIIAGLVELYSDKIRIDDNFSITLTIAICLYILL